ncbi:MAG: VWA domain-containing protein [Hyphomicrobiaceae bacterium]
MTDPFTEMHAARLDPNLAGATADGGRIAENILQFARLLRSAGVPIGPDRVILATRAVLAAGIESPAVLYWTLHASLVSRPEHHDLFDQAFYLFWRDPGFLEQMLSVMVPSLRSEEEAKGEQLSRRLRERLLRSPPRLEIEAQEKVELDLSDTFSAEEQLKEKDFEQMSGEEQAQARAAIRRMALLMEERPTRRFRQDRSGRRVDMRRVLRESASRGREHIALRFKSRVQRAPPLVVLCDISGSMDTYARMLLHFLYAVTNARDRVSAFLFGTRLTNITRSLKGRDPDAAIAQVARDVKDWAGGTRIGDSLEQFNRSWARRVLGQNAMVLLITDGLDRQGGEGIGAAARRLRASSRRLVWLNPLMRYDGYSPLAQGARELIAYVSEMRPCHNLKSLEQLAEALASSSRGNRRPLPLRGSAEHRRRA